ncbi:steroid receptor RNA activator 1-like [Ptychodera flava]|uniref:steroid receptor RNA activator 1-like n=1 Tax=Ptychodera flava TaxID=63121 RepID=UPI003969C986
MAALKPGNPERGWNDPPMFSYDVESASQKSPRRNQLNKRVGHDLTALGTKSSGSPKVSSTAPPPAGPPLLRPPTGLPPPSLPTTASNDKTEISGITEDSSDAGQISTEKSINLKEDCLSKLRKDLSRIEKLVSIKVSEDISRKLEILSDMWENNKLCESVQRRTSELATALSKSDCDKANEIHVGLMVDHVSEVSQWMVAIKRLIHEIRKLPKVESDSPDDNKGNGDSEDTRDVFNEESNSKGEMKETVED